jgi:hypothetical protein
MFMSTHSPSPVVLSLPQKCPAELTRIALEGLLTNSNDSNESDTDIFDLETREQILQSFMVRMRQVCYLRRLSISKIRVTSQY